MKITIGVKIFSVYAVALLGIVILSLASYVSVRHIGQNFHEAGEQRDLVDLLDGFHDFILESQEGQRAFLLTGNRESLAKLAAAGPSLDAKIQSLRDAPAADGRAAEIAAIEAVAKPLLAQLSEEAGARGGARCLSPRSSRRPGSSATSRPSMRWPRG